MKHSTKSGTRSIITEIAVGLLVAIMVSVILGGTVSALVLNGTVAEKDIKYFVMAIQLLASFLGALFAGKRVGKQYAVICGITTASYCFVLFAATILLFQSAFQRVGAGLGMCATGYLVACTMCMIKKGKRHRHK